MISQKMERIADTSKTSVELKLIETEEDRLLAKEIVENHHSYVPTYTSVGRRIDWLIYVDGILSGMIGIGSATYPPCKDLLRYLGMSKDDYRKAFNTIANNWRFCMSRDCPNVGTKILKILRHRARIEWWKKYGDDLDYLMTFVGSGHKGAVYLADNWECVGKTAGLPKHKSVSMKWDSASGTNTISDKFVKPTGENAKLIFVKKLRYGKRHKTSTSTDTEC